MTLVQFPKRHRFAQAPILVLVDLQAEYVTQGRAFYVEDNEPCLENCRRLLNGARHRGMPVAHFRQVLPGPFFSDGSEFAGWIADFRPLPNEAVYHRDVPSIYRNDIFRSFVSAMDEPLVLLAGLTSEHACLSSVIDAVHLGHRIAFIEDASSTMGFGGREAAMCHGFVTDLIAEYCEVISTNEAIGRFVDADPKTWQAMGG